MAGYITPALGRFMTAVRREFPDIKLGLYNRRRIAGSLSWSQHSWPNAADLFFTVYGDTSAAHQLRLAEVARWLRTAYPHPEDVRYLLWLVKNHYDHIHIDFWPKGYGTPSKLRGGLDNRYKTKDGRVITQLALAQEGDDELAFLTEAQQKELALFLDLIKGEGSNVHFVKHAIRLIRRERELHLHDHPEEPFTLDDYEIIIQRKEV